MEVPLQFDSEFFSLLQGDLSQFDALQAGEQGALSDGIKALSTELCTLTKTPTKFNKSDLDSWRILFEIYVQARVFFRQMSKTTAVVTAL